MKSVLSKSCCEKKEKPFPKLMVGNDYLTKGVIILFNNKNTGVVVNSNNNKYRLAEYSTSWTPQYYSDYEGDVCLTNSED